MTMWPIRTEMVKHPVWEIVEAIVWVILHVILGRLGR